MLMIATGGGPPSRILVCPQYAMTYFDGCQLTVGDGASAGTRCSGTPVSVAHWRLSEKGEVEMEEEATYDVDVISRVGDREIFAVMGEAECVYAMSGYIVQGDENENV